MKNISEQNLKNILNFNFFAFAILYFLAIAPDPNSI